MPDSIDVSSETTPRLVRWRALSISAVILTLVLVTVQSGTKGAPKPNIPATREEPPDLSRLKTKGNTLFLAGDYRTAIQTYQQGYEEATRRSLPRIAVRFLNNLGGVQYRTFHYRDAIHSYLAARDLATSVNDRETLGALNMNLSSLYLRMGETAAARESAERGLKLPPEATAKYRAKLLIQCALIKARQSEPRPAAVLLREAIETARAQTDMASEAEAWNELGNVLLDLRELPAAERALLEAFRLRKLTKGDLYFAYESLSHLRVLQGDLQAASDFCDQALARARVGSPPALWIAYYDRGRVKLAQSRLEEAFADFGAALASARQWRSEVLPADTFRVSSEVELDRVYSSYIEAGMRLYAQTGRKQFAALAFEAAEEGRAASLRALWAGPDLTKRLPEEYWQALADLYRAESSFVKAGAAGNPAAIRGAELKLAEMETRAGLDFPRTGATAAQSTPIESTQKLLRPSEVYLGFHLGESESCLWMVTRDGFEIRRLPGRAHFVETIGRFVNALRDNSPDALAQGNALYAELFGAAPARFLEKPVWIVAPDGALFELPFAALVEGKEYVVERHAVRTVTGISALSPGTAPVENAVVVGVGDPIYNRADGRLPHTPAQHGPLETANPPMEFARLPGTGREVEKCSAIWRSRGYDPTLLTGEAASREKLMEGLRRQPAVVHVAAHFLFPPQPVSPGMMALAMKPGSGIELLSATEISVMRLNLGLVVLNGCGSGRAPALPGAGLMGMTRAWLAAGARGVIATRWAVSDQGEGELFPSFYDRFPAPRSSSRESFAELLREAQLAELHAGGERAKTARWAAYFCVERY
jgi:CHAT domain-containing protein